MSTTSSDHGRERTAYTVTLRPVPRGDDPQGVRRLRAALKCLLRSFGLRCTSVAPAPGDESLVKDSPEGSTATAAETVLEIGGGADRMKHAPEVLRTPRGR